MINIFDIIVSYTFKLLIWNDVNLSHPVAVDRLWTQTCPRLLLPQSRTETIRLTLSHCAVSVLCKSHFIDMLIDQKNINQLQACRTLILHSGFDLFTHDVRSWSPTVTTRDLNHELKPSHYYKNIDRLLYWPLKWTVQSLLSPPGSAVRVSGPGPRPQPPCRPAERWHQVFDAAGGAKRLLALLLRPHLPWVGVQTLWAQGRVHLVLPQQQLLLRWLPPPSVTVVTVYCIIHLLATWWPGRSLLYFLFGLITLTPLHRGGKVSAARHAERSRDLLGGGGILTGHPLLVLVGGAVEDVANGLLVGGGGDAEGRRGRVLCDLWPLQREGCRSFQSGFLCWSLLAGISLARLWRGRAGRGGFTGGDEDIDIGQRLSPVLRSSHLQSWTVLLHLTCNQEVHINSHLQNRFYFWRDIRWSFWSNEIWSSDSRPTRGQFLLHLYYSVD